jgi:vancomycin resistance protein YoaR
LRRSDYARTSRRHRRPYRSGLRFYAPIIAGALIAIVVLAIVIDSAVYYNRVHAGVSIAGTGMSRSTRDQAAAKLTALVAEAQRSPITLVGESKTWDLMPTEVGTSMDIGVAVEAAMAASRDGNIFTNLGKRIKLYFRGKDIPLAGAVDKDKLAAYLDDLAAELDVAPVDAGLEFEGGKVRLVEEQNGTAVDKELLQSEIEDLLLTLHTTRLNIPMKVIEPTVQADDVQPAIDQANIMLSGPITLTGNVDDGQKTWTLTASQIADFMDFRSKDVNGVSTLEPFLSAEKMEAFFAPIDEAVTGEPVDAKFATDGKKAWVVPSKPGTKLDPEKTAEAATEAALKTTGRTLVVTLTEKEAELTTEKAEAMGIKDLLGSHTATPYAGSANRQHNVRITTQYASDVILAPGEIYDFDKQIGARTAARGYRTAPGIVGPGKLEDVFGGGICEVSTALFNAAFFSALEIVERKNHSIYISHYPKGRDATVSAGSPNMRFKNDTKHHILIKGASDGVTTTFNIYGTSEGRKVTYTTSDFYNHTGKSTVTIKNPALGTGTTLVRTSGQSGMQCKVVRTITYPDGKTKQETFISTYPMVPMTVEVGTGSTTTTTTVPGSTTTTGPTPTTPPSTSPPTTAAPPSEP